MPLHKQNSKKWGGRKRKMELDEKFKIIFLFLLFSLTFIFFFLFFVFKNHHFKSTAQRLMRNSVCSFIENVFEGNMQLKRGGMRKKILRNRATDSNIHLRKAKNILFNTLFSIKAAFMHRNGAVYSLYAFGKHFDVPRNRI